MLSAAKSSARCRRRALRFKHHGVVGGVRDRAARRQRRECGAPASAQNAIDRVAMQMRAAPSALRVKPFRKHQHDFAEVIARQVAEWIGTLVERQQFILSPFLQRDFGDDLLR